jgi:microcystin-dependent protein
MTETHGFFGDATDVRYYSQLPILEFIRDFRLNGYTSGVGGELEVGQHTSPNMSVDIATGETWVQGNLYQSGAVETLTISAADTTYPRIDRIILRNDIKGAREITLQVLKGEPSGTPSAPDYLRNDDFWDLVLADIAVAANATTITTGNISDKRDVEALCGVASPSEVRFSDILPGDQLDLQGFKAIDLADPAADNDSATIKYRSDHALQYPVGIQLPFAGLSVPDKWLECDHSEKSRTTYATLFTEIGEQYGAGDGSTTFNLPDGRGRSIFGYHSAETEFNAIGKTGGEKTHTLTFSEYPAHTHSGSVATITCDNYAGPASYQSEGLCKAQSSTNSTGGGGAHENMAPYIVKKWIIKAVA